MEQCVNIYCNVYMHFHVYFCFHVSYKLVRYFLLCENWWSLERTATTKMNVLLLSSWPNHQSLIPSSNPHKSLSNFCGLAKQTNGTHWELHTLPIKRFIFSLCILSFSHALWINVSRGTFWNGDRGKCLHTSRKSYILTLFSFEFTNPSIPEGYEEWDGIRPHAYETHRVI